MSERKLPVRFRHYKNSGSLETSYIFGVNVYRNRQGFTIDLIIGKHLFAVIVGK